MRLPALDGLRAGSILLVLAAHLLPLGPKALHLNSAAGLMGMALFFALSGFLIVRFLAEGMPISKFALRRLARIVPLAWLAMLILWAGSGGPLAANLLFVSNLPPGKLLHGGEHLWSLCVEVQFYAVAAVLCLVHRKALYAVPALCVLVTLFRVYSNEPISIVTWHRVDEILAGGTLALIYCGWLGDACATVLKRSSLPVATGLLFACCYVQPLLFLRPYAGALVIGSAIYNLDPLSNRLLVNRYATYIANVSYALYVFHGMLTVTWLGSGDVLIKYLKRPLLFAATFALAHLSTFHLERPITRWVRGSKVDRLPAA